MNMFLVEVRQRHPGEYILMILDGAGWQKSKGMVIPEGMELVALPPYCPDLNPQERVWEELREKAFGNRVFASLKAVTDAATKGFQNIEANPDALKRLGGREWILEPL